MTTFTLPPEYGYVIIAGVWTGIALTITLTLAGAKRDAAGVKYPNFMASDIRGEQDQKAFLFNCAQRGAHNPHESYTIALAGLLIGGLTFPIGCSVLGALWGVGAIGYYLGYSEDPKKRYSKGGFLMRLSGILLQLAPLATAYVLLTGRK